MDDLFTDGLTALLRPRLHELNGALTFENIEQLGSSYGPRSNSRFQPIGKPWANAEEFLSVLDTAASDAASTWASVLNGQSPNIIAELNTAAARYVGVATDHFVPKDHREVKALERWSPYLQWAASSMHAGIISFNYDRVVEAASEGRRCPVLPRETTGYAKADGFYKLHGSVTWAYDEAGKGPVETAETGMELIAKQRRPFLGLPGPGKQNATNGVLSRLWGDALAMLRQAERVHIVGYRFPPGDVSAQQKLLGALADNAMTNLEVRIVLGPNTQTPDTLRVKGLVEWSLRHRTGKPEPKIVVPPLYAEDYLGLFQ